MPSINFIGKTFVQNHHLAVPFRQLIPKPELSLLPSTKEENTSTPAPSLHDNLIIQGDNLDALKALLPTYAGKVKCIYIDPPYNTGNEGWVYNDNLKAPLIKEWLGKVVGKEGEDLTRHDKWLCMMTPRLKLLRELLSEDGVIFVSIDDNEQAHLKLLMDEIFGEQNFVSNIIWQKKFSPQNDAKYFSDDHDFIVCYAKNKRTGDTGIGWCINLLTRTDEHNARYMNIDNDSRGDWSSSDLSVKRITEKDRYEIKLPNGKTLKPPEGRSWSVSKERFEELVKDNRIWFGEDGSNTPRLKRFLSEVQDGIVPKTIWTYQDVGHNQSAKQEIKEIFEESNTPFDTPKPTTLIKKILKIATNPGDIILDSFAGSGTTAQAVLELNKEDGGNRKFILIEMEDYANDITAERVRRVIKGVPHSRKEYLKTGLSGTFSYFELGKAIEMESLLDGSNLPDWTEMARYLFYTATGEQYTQQEEPAYTMKSPENVEEEMRQAYIGSSTHFEVYMLYRPELEWLKTNAFNTDQLYAIPKPPSGKHNLVFAPAKYISDDVCKDHQCVFQQLPYEIYKLEK